MTLQLVEVTWDDARSAGGAERWVDYSEFEKLAAHPAACISVGYVLSDNGNVLSLASSLNYADDKLNQVSGTIIIPRGMIRKIRKLK